LREGSTGIAGNGQWCGKTLSDPTGSEYGQVVRRGIRAMVAEVRCPKGSSCKPAEIHVADPVVHSAQDWALEPVWWQAHPAAAYVRTCSG
jgi:hypothetical protein